MNAATAAAFCGETEVEMYNFLTLKDLNGPPVSALVSTGRSCSQMMFITLTALGEKLFLRLFMCDLIVQQGVHTGHIWILKTARMLFNCPTWPDGLPERSRNKPALHSNNRPDKCLRQRNDFLLHPCYPDPPVSLNQRKFGVLDP